MRGFRYAAVTLSTCDTGVGGGQNAQGEEVERLGTLVQKQGAKGVIATLWPAVDDSTALLMQNFYQPRETKKLSKVDALRQAQFTLVRRQLAPGAGSELQASVFLGAVHPDG